MGIFNIVRGRDQIAWLHKGRLQKSRLRPLAVCAGLMCAAVFGNPAAADLLQTGIRAFAARNYVKAAQVFTDLAPQGNPMAQTYLGYMYANGKGVPQDFIVAAGWYRCASQQGVADAQYMLGLMYDKAQGVPQDYVKAYALVNLAVAKAGQQREPWVRVRDAIASKLSLAERTMAQQMSFEGVPEVPCLPMFTGVAPPWPLVQTPLIRWPFIQ